MESGPRRKYYRITKQGRSQLLMQRQQWRTIDAALQSLWAGLTREALPAQFAPRG
jgi:DNA-binding PadR family transcriptional regulator